MKILIHNSLQTDLQCLFIAFNFKNYASFFYIISKLFVNIVIFLIYIKNYNLYN